MDKSKGLELGMSFVQVRTRYPQFAALGSPIDYQVFPKTWNTCACFVVDPSFCTSFCSKIVRRVESWDIKQIGEQNIPVHSEPL